MSGLWLKEVIFKLIFLDGERVDIERRIGISLLRCGRQVKGGKLSLM